MSAPDIPGYEFLRPLGSGGFADVYQYEQEMPRRTVAIKVLRSEALTPRDVRTFVEEANLTARLSAHPAIVTVHSAGVLPDGRPYLVMEHCSRPNLGKRFRTEVFAVADALAIGVQLAGAVETAHRAGVVHRDIKPANVLGTPIGRPALADFGIASTTGRAAAGEVDGYSLPWSPPESVDGSWSGPATDVYALAATVYSLLAGRAPFEAGEAGAAEHAKRILHDPVPPTGRTDVPESLEEVLRTAMAKSPHGRHTSALSLGRALQRVQREIGAVVTPIDVLDESVEVGAQVHGATTVRRLPQADAAAATARWQPTADPEAPTRPAPAPARAPTPSPARAPAPAEAVTVRRVPHGSDGESTRPLRVAEPWDARTAHPQVNQAAPTAAGGGAWGVALDVLLAAVVIGAGAYYLLT